MTGHTRSAKVVAPLWRSLVNLMVPAPQGCSTTSCSVVGSHETQRKNLSVTSQSGLPNGRWAMLHSRAEAVRKCAARHTAASHRRRQHPSGVHDLQRGAEAVGQGGEVAGATRATGGLLIPHQRHQQGGGRGQAEGTL